MAILQLAIDARRARQEANEFNQAASGVVRSANAMADAVGNKVYSAFARIASISTMVYALKQVTAAAMEQERIERQLSASLDLTGNASKYAMSELDKFANEMQRLTVYSNEQVLAEMNVGKNLGITTNRLKEAAMAAAGLAASHPSLLTFESAMELIGRASQGSTTMLSRYGIKLSDSMSAQEKFNAVIRRGIDDFRLAEVEAQTASGQIEQLGNEWHNAKASFGEAFLPVVTEQVRDLTKALRDHNSEIKTFGQVIATEVSAVANLFNLTGKWIEENSLIIQAYERYKINQLEGQVPKLRKRSDDFNPYSTEFADPSDGTHAHTVTGGNVVNRGIEAYAAAKPATGENINTMAGKSIVDQAAEDAKIRAEMFDLARESSRKQFEAADNEVRLANMVNDAERDRETQIINLKDALEKYNISQEAVNSVVEKYRVKLKAAQTAMAMQEIRDMTQALKDEEKIFSMNSLAREHSTDLIKIEKMARNGLIPDVDKATAAYMREAKALEDLQRSPVAFSQKIEQWGKDATNVWSNLGDVAVKTLNDTSDALADMVTTGKIDFRSLTQSMISDIIHVMMRASMANIVGSMFGQGTTGGNAFGGIMQTIFAPMAGGGSNVNVNDPRFGSPWGNTSSVSPSSATGVHVMHSGGLVGYDYAPERYVPSSIFNDAPRFHNGLAPDELPAILQRGERVLSRKEVANNSNNQENGNSVNVYMTNNISAMDSQDVHRALVKGSDTITGIVQKAIRNNNPLRRNLKE